MRLFKRNSQSKIKIEGLVSKNELDSQQTSEFTSGSRDITDLIGHLNQDKAEGWLLSKFNGNGLALFGNENYSAFKIKKKLTMKKNIGSAKSE